MEKALDLISDSLNEIVYNLENTKENSEIYILEIM